VCLAILNVMYDGLKPKICALPTLVNMVRAGKIGANQVKVSRLFRKKQQKFLNNLYSLKEVESLKVHFFRHLTLDFKTLLMAKIVPFKAVRPTRDKVCLVTCRSYEEYVNADSSTIRF
jgi:hypothetical protein